MIGFIYKIDTMLLDGIQSLCGCAFLDMVMPFITSLGNGGAVWIAIAVVMIATKKYRRHGVLMLALMLVGLLVGNLVLKNLVTRARPCWGEEISLLIANPSDFSFPSGHTLSSVIAAATITSANKKFGFFAIPLAILIAFSRLYLYVHYPTDVLFSVILGLIIFFTGNFAMLRMLK